MVVILSPASGYEGSEWQTQVQAYLCRVETPTKEQEKNQTIHPYIPILHLHNNHEWKIFRGGNCIVTEQCRP